MVFCLNSSLKVKVIAVIPAHLNSIRFPRKILFPIYGLPMIEHVRRRASFSQVFSDVIVATCDREIANLVKSHNGKVVMTSNTHVNGTNRVAEAVKKIDCTHVVVLQGDEPLILPNQLQIFNDAIEQDPAISAWNATGKIDDESDLNKHSFVKCIVTQEGFIDFCFRYYSKLSSKKRQAKIIKKILGIIAYRKDFLQEIITKSSSWYEKKELIEQMKIIDNGYKLKSVNITPTLPSVNEPHEIDIINEWIVQNDSQQKLLKIILKMK